MLMPIATLLGLLTPGPIEPSSDRVASFRQHVEFLASDALAGRASGTAGGAEAAEYVARQFARLGLEPAGDGGTSFQEFPLDGTHQARNVLGIWPGRGDLADGTVIIAAHYDHLPPGDSTEGDSIYNGADDNASGVAALLLVAEALAEDRDSLPASHRAVIFAAFDAEERGLLGSRHYVSRPARPLEGTAAVINFDQVGRLRGGTLLALDGDSCPDLAALLRRVGPEHGLTVRTDLGGAVRSDQAPFLERRIPAFQLHTGLHADYHRPSDEAGSVDCDGGARVAAVASLALRRAMEDSGPLPFQSLDPVGDVGRALAIARKLGVIPNLGAQRSRYPQVALVLPGSLAARHGLRLGDQIKAINGSEFARPEEALRAITRLHFDRELAFVLLRGGREVSLRVPADELVELMEPAFVAPDGSEEPSSP